MEPAAEQPEDLSEDRTLKGDVIAAMEPAAEQPEDQGTIVTRNYMDPPQWSRLLSSRRTRVQRERY